MLDRTLEDKDRAVSEFVPAYMYPRLQEAWGEVSTRFDVVTEQIRSGMHEGPLEDHGLRDPNFRLKAEGFWRNARAWWANPTRHWLGKALAWGNVVLTSLSAVLPAAGMIDEFKQALERAIDDKEDEGELAAQEGPPTAG